MGFFPSVKTIEHSRVHFSHRAGIFSCGLSGFFDGAWRWCGDRAAAGLGVPCGYSLCDRGLFVSVIATSSGAAAAYVREGYSNIRIGMFLEIATTVGALFGATVAANLSTAVIAVIFGLVLIYSAYSSSQPKAEVVSDAPPDRLATLLRMDGSYPTPNGPRAYHAHAIPTGFSLMFLAGMLSGLLGIGSGAVKVLAMDQAMRLPFKVSTTTSNFMIG